MNYRFLDYAQEHDKTLDRDVNLSNKRILPVKALNEVIHVN